MADFEFLKDSSSNKWVILAPRRSKRTNAGEKPAEICPFCVGQEGEEEELYRSPEGTTSTTGTTSNWQVRVIPNKFPFTPHHEIIIHSPDHHKNFDELPLSQVELILKAYRARFRENSKYGRVYIFHNRGAAAGESLPHPHSQLAVIPQRMEVDIPVLDVGKFPISNFKFQMSNKLIGNWIFDIGNYLKFLGTFSSSPKKQNREEYLETERFYVFCPETTGWPEEVWIAPKMGGRVFGEIGDVEITDLAFALSRVAQLYDLRHGHESPFNFYISPDKNWYLRFIPRIKTLGGFELGTGIMVNTQDPKETFAFLKEHFFEPDAEKIRKEQKADYWRSV